jgi:hypothetical protein
VCIKHPSVSPLLPRLRATSNIKFS